MQLIEKAQSEKKDINVTSNNTPRCLLHYGVLAGLPDEGKYHNLKKLVDLGADREQRDEHGRTPLHLAVLLGDTKAVDVLLEAGCDTTVKCHGNNLMHLATISGDPDMFHKVRELGFDPRELTEYRFTSMYLAACYNQHQMVPLLKRYGVDVNHRIEIVAGIFSLFNQAIMPVGLSFFLLYALKDLRGKAHTLVETKIMQRYSDSNVFQNEILCSFNVHSSNVAENNPVGDPPLVVATSLGFVQCVKALVENGADPLCVDSNGRSLLHLAMTIGHLELVKYLFDQQKSCGVSIAQSTIWLAVINGAVDIVEFLVEMNTDFAFIIPNSPFSPMSLVDVAAFLNQPEILQFARTIECKSGTSRPREANFLLLFSIIGSWFLNIISKAVPKIAPVIQVTEERQRAVISAILDMPGCEPMEIMPFLNGRAVDAAVLLCQSTALSVILDHVKVPSRLLYYPTYSILSFPLLHICAYSSVFFQNTLRTDEKLNFLSLVNPSIDEFCNIVDLLLKHGYDINVVDSSDNTCLDHAMQVATPEMENYLRSRGALTGMQLKKKKQNFELTEKMEETTHLVAQLEDDKKKLVEEKKELMIENQELRLQNEDLSKKMDGFLKHLSPLFSFLNPGSNPPTQPVTTPSTSVTKPSPSVPITSVSPSVPVSMMSLPVPDTTPTNPLLTTPTLHQLNQLVFRQIALDWYSVGLHLEMEVLTLKIIEADVYPPSVEKCCRTMFSKWLSHDEGTGGAPRLWKTVLKALKDVGHIAVVGDVERVLFEQNQ